MKQTDRMQTAPLRSRLGKAASVLVFAAVAWGQTQPATPPPAGSISGVVKDVTSGAPIRDARVGLRAGTRNIEGVSGADGRYELREVPPGQYQVRVSTANQGQMGFGPYRERTVTVGPGQDVGSIDFPLYDFGQISGKVLDENKEPVPGAWVLQVAREYRLGALRYVFAGMSATNDQGEYQMQRIQPGRPILLAAMKTERKLDAISNAPADPKLRKRATVTTFYPDAISPEGGQVMTLRSGEDRRGIDFSLRRSPSFCMDGVLLGPTGPAALSFTLEEAQATNGLSGNGGFYAAMPSGKTAADGKFRICDLHPGGYLMRVMEWPASRDVFMPYYGTVLLSVTDKDVHDLRIAATPKTSVSGEVAWDGAAPETPMDAKVTIGLQAITRAYMGGELSGPPPSANIPGPFSIPQVLVDDYELSVRGVPAGSYIKDITYGGNSIFHKPFRPGSAGDQKLRVTLARDGGRIGVKAADKDGNPVGDTSITLLPDSSLPDPEYAALIISGRTDQLGRYRSGVLAPGKYYVLAAEVANDNSPDTVAKLRRARTKAKEVEVNAGATAQVEIELVNVD